MERKRTGDIIMKYGRVWARTGAAFVAAFIACLVCAGAYAISPEQYRSALEENVEAYSDTRDWRRVAGQLCADETDVRDGEGTFVITDDAGNDYLTTGAVRISISGDVRDGHVASISVNIRPTAGLTREYEYQAFSISEIAFESLLSPRAAHTDMSAYLFLYDVYPYAMWARDSEFGDNSCSMDTALGGTRYAIRSASQSDGNVIMLNVEIRGEADDDDETEARANLNANYALESICSLVYELDVCKGTCITLAKQDECDADTLGSLLDDMRACAQEYYALGAQDYDKLKKLTKQLDPEFDNMLYAIDSLEQTATDDAIDALLGAVKGMCEALKVMY